MREQYLLLDVDKSEFCIDLHPNEPLILGDNPEIGLKNLFLWLTYPNISERYQNNTIKIFAEGQWTEFSIPEGLYDVDQLNVLLASKFNDCIQFKVNLATFKCLVMLKEKCKVDFTNSKLNEVLGLEKKIYEKSEEGKNVINITRGVDRILIRCNLIERPHQEQYCDVLYDILPIGQPGSAAHVNVENVEFFKCKNKVIRRICIRITDLKNNLIKMNEPLSLKLVFRSTS